MIKNEVEEFKNISEISSDSNFEPINQTEKDSNEN